MGNLSCSLPAGQIIRLFFPGVIIPQHSSLPFFLIMYVVLSVGARGAVPSIGAVLFFSLPQVGSSPFLTARLQSRSEAGSETGVAPSKARCQASTTTGSKCSTWPLRGTQTFVSRAAWGWWAKRLLLPPRRPPPLLPPPSRLSPTPPPRSWRPQRPPAAPPQPPAAESSRPRPERRSRSGTFFLFICWCYTSSWFTHLSCKSCSIYCLNIWTFLGTFW